MIELPWSTLVAVALTITGAYVVYGLTGFGSTIVAMPLLAHWLPLRFAVPMMLIFDVGAGLLLGWKNHRLVNWRELMRLVPWLLLGMGAGVTMLVNAPERVLLLLLGVFVFGLAGWSLLRHRPPRQASAIWSVPTGLVGGVFSALYGVGGVVYTTYLLRRLADKSVLRASVGTLILGTAIVRLVLFTGTGLYQQTDLLRLGFALLPCALLGYWVGNHLHAKLPVQRVVQAVWWILLVGGLSVWVRALAL